MLGDRELTPNSATYKLMEEAYEQALRICNGRYNWTFARVLDRAVEASPDAPDTYELPADCMRIIELRWSDGHKVAEPRHGVNPSNMRRCIKSAERVGEPMFMTYTADILKLGANAPSSAPLFAEAVTLMCAAQAAPGVTGELGTRSDFVAQAEAVLKEAILADRRQDYSNDRVSLRDFFEADALGLSRVGRRRSIELYY